jgi:two-component system phosphate regulon sensor histidine kinase PhoR
MNRRAFPFKLYAGYAAAVIAVTLLVVLIVGSSLMAREDATRGDVLWPMLVAAGIAVVLALVIGIAAAQRAGRRLRAIAVAAEAVARGHDDVLIQRGEPDAIGQLADSVSRITLRLRGQLGETQREHGQVLAILGSMVEGVIAVDREERVVHLNGAASAILETSPEKCLGRPLWECIRVSGITEQVAAVMKGRTPAPRELLLPRGGMTRILELHASPLRDGGGGVTGAVVVLHDVTELRRLESVRRDFVANVSHELKTPLTAIRGLTETLIDDCEMTPETRARFLSKVHAQTERLSNLVADLLTLSRLESDDGSPPFEPTDLRPLLADAVRLLNPRVQEKRIELVIDIPETPVVVLAEDEAVRQVTGNLLDNAVKYTPEGGKVFVKLAPGEPGYCVFEVRDTGIGIEEKHHDRVFERFYRVDKARSRELGGTGLGLSIVKHAVLSMGGTVGLSSSPGQGSTFTVKLPLAGKDSVRSGATNART